MFFVAYFALVLTFAGILVAMESQTGGRCGFEGYSIYTNASSYFELAYERECTSLGAVHRALYTSHTLLPHAQCPGRP
jgi:hypothetical protein